MANRDLFLSSSLLLYISLFLTLSSGHPEAIHGVTKEVAVEGKLYCQSCSLAGTWSLTGAKTLPAAKVGISCKDTKNRVMFYKSFQADAGGYFYAQLRGLAVEKIYMNNPIHACKVHLLSSPNEDCNLLTNVNYGIDGAPLRDENKTLSGTSYRAEIYAAGPLAFQPAFCPPAVHY